CDQIGFGASSSRFSDDRLAQEFCFNSGTSPLNGGHQNFPPVDPLRIDGDISAFNPANFLGAKQLCWFFQSRRTWFAMKERSEPKWFTARHACIEGRLTRLPHLFENRNCFVTSDQNVVSAKISFHCWS